MKDGPAEAETAAPDNAALEDEPTRPAKKLKMMPKPTAVPKAKAEPASSSQEPEVAEQAQNVKLVDKLMEVAKALKPKSALRLFKLAKKLAKK